MPPAPARVRQDARVLKVLARVGGASTIALLGYLLIPLDREFGVLVSLGVLAGVLVLLLPMTVRHAVKIEQSSEPLVDAAQALCTLLALLMVGFATVHFSVAANFEHQYDGIETKVDSLYFTVTVLATVGFGDITPIGQAARVVTIVQMLFDLLFIGLAIRLLGHALGTRKEDIGRREP